MNYNASGAFLGAQAQDKPSPCGDCALASCRFRTMNAPKGALTRHTLKRGEDLECRGEGCLRFWIIQSGSASICTFFQDGRRQILSIEGRGDALCVAAALPDSEQRLEALTDCTICELDLSPWAAELRHDAGFLALTFHLMHARLEKSTLHLAKLGRLDSQERVTYFLAEMAARSPGRDALVTLPMSREDIADYLGLNTDSVSRIMTRIRKSGLVRFVSPTEYVVPDPEALARRLPVALPEDHGHGPALGGPLA